jgi:PmbA protein
MLEPPAALSIAQKLVDRSLAAGATAVDAAYSGDRSTTVQVRLGKLEQVSDAEGESLSLRIFDGARSASVASSDFSEEALEQLIDRCVAMARQAPEDAFSGLAPADLLERAPPMLELGDLAEVGPDQLLQRALEAEAAALAVQGVSNSTGSGASASAQVFALATSAGFAGAYRSGGHGTLAGVIAGEGAAMQRDYSYHSVRYLADLDQAREIGSRAGERAVARLNPTRVKAGTYPVLFDPRVSASLLNHFAAAISGSAVARGTSFLKDRLGERVFAPGSPSSTIRYASAACARIRSTRKAFASDAAPSSRTASCASGSPTAPPRASSASSPPAMPRAGAGPHPRTCTWNGASAAAKSCSPPSPKRCWWWS